MSFTKPKNPHEVEIQYPKLKTKPWVPAHELPREPRPPAYVKPAGVTQKLNVSNLDKIWHHFRYFGNKSVISGSFSQSHKRFKVKKNGHQGAANCIMACIFSKINKMEYWDRNMLDRLLVLGDVQYEKTVALMSGKNMTMMQVPQVYNILYVGTFKLTFNVPGDPVQASVGLDQDRVVIVKKSLMEFLKTYPSGIIFSERRHIALWASNKAYYLFDPSEHNEDATKWTGLAGTGHAICVRFAKIENLARFLVEDLATNPDVLRMKIYPCALLRFEKLELNAPKDLSAVKASKDETKTKSKSAILTSKATSGEAKPKARAKKKDDEKEEIRVKRSTKSLEAIKKMDEINPNVRNDPDHVGKRPAWLSNIPIVKRDDRRVKIPEEPARKKSATYFEDFGAGSILRASTHQTDSKFSRFKDGEQSVSQAVAALVMRRIAPVAAKWSKRIVNDVLKLGETIHHKSLKDAPEGPFKLASVMKKITWDGKDFAPIFDEMTVLGNLSSERDDVLALLPALADFFKGADACVVCGPAVVAVWFENGGYFMYDPNERDARGRAIRTVGDDAGLVRMPGSACVMRFAELKHLVDLYVWNLPRERRADDYSISKVVVEDYVGVPEPWFNFAPIEDGKWILRGSFSQASHVFKSDTRNTQCTANAAMAIAFNYIRSPQEWSKRTVDQVLLSGDELYKATLDRLVQQQRFVDRHLMVDEINRNFSFSNKEILFEIKDCLVNGMVDAPDAGDILNVKNGFLEFFKNHDYGIFTSHGISLAVWKRDDAYFYFDSHSRDERGMITGYGTACVLRIARVDELADLIEANLGVDGAHMYNISAVDVAMLDADADAGGVVYYPTHNYGDASDVAIVRAGASAKDPKYAFRAGRQTVPACVAALAMNRLRASVRWDADVLDAILDIGDRYFAECMADYERREDDDEDGGITSKNLRKQLSIGVNEIGVEVEGVAEGTIQDAMVNAIVDFYDQNRVVTDDDHLELLLETEDMTVSIWKDDNFFYTFDPYPRDENGDVIGRDDWSEPDESEVNTQEDEIQDDDARVVVEEVADEEELDEEVEELKPRPRSRGEDVFSEDAESNRSDDVDGKACAKLYRSADELARALLANTRPRRRRQGAFTLSRVKIANTPALKRVHDNASYPEDVYAGDWHAFRELDRGFWILRGTIDASSATFPAENRGKQVYPSCVVALAFAKLFPMSQMKATNANAILIYGDRLLTYAKNQRRYALQQDKALRLLDPEIDAIVNNEEYRLEDVPKTLAIGDKRIAMRLEMQKVVGDVRATAEDKDVLDLSRGLDRFFAANSMGLLECKGYTVAIWKGETIKYMFDPHTTGVNGTKAPIGAICITRFLNTDQMAKVFLENLPQKRNNFFYIHAIEATIEPFRRVKDDEEAAAAKDVEQMQRDVKITSFSNVVPGKAILRGGVNQESGGRGAHALGAPIAFVALTMSLIHKASTWARPIVDECVALGERLFVATLKELQGEFNPWKDVLDPYHVNRDFDVGVMHANCQLRSCDQRGVLDVRDPNVLNLRQGLERFFDENTHGVLYAPPNVCLAFWEEQEEGDAGDATYYMYDPNPRGPTGLPSGTGRGVACVVTFATLKIAAEHVLACLVDADARACAFTIVPVEIAVGPYRTRCDKKKKKKPCGGGRCGGGDAKRVAKKKALIARKKEESKRDYWQSRTGYRAIARGVAIVRGTRSQSSDAYPAKSRGLQDIPNAVVAYVASRIVPLDRWTYAEIDLVLDIGNQLYIDSYIAYAPKDRKLGLRNVLRNIYVMNKRAHVTIYEPYEVRAFDAAGVATALDRCFLDTDFCILRHLDVYVGVFFAKGYYYTFDAHARGVAGGARGNEVGAACVVKYDRLDDLAARVVENLTPACAARRSAEFWLVLVKLEGGICSCEPNPMGGV